MDIKSKIHEQKRLFLILPLGLMVGCALAFDTLGGGKGIKKNETAQVVNDFIVPDATQKELLDKTDAINAEEEERKKEAEINNEMIDVSAINTNDIDKTNQENVNAEILSSYKEVYNSTPMANTEATVIYPPTPNYDDARVRNKTNAEINRAYNKVNNNSQNIVEEHSSTVSYQNSGFNGGVVSSNYTNSENNYQGDMSIEISAVVHGNQTIRYGGVIKFRTLKDFTVNGIIIPKNTFIYGQASVNNSNTSNNSRINISVRSIRFQGKLITLNLNVYDAGDGQSGLYIEGLNTLNQASNDIGSSATSEVTSEIGSNVPIVGGIINSAVNSIERNRNSPKASISSNYRVIIK